MISARTLAAALLLLASPALALDLFESPNGDYSLIYSDDWQPDTSPAPDSVSLDCIHPICEGTIQASILVAPDYRYARDTYDKLFTRMHPDRFIDMVKANAAAVGTVKELQYPKRQRIGNVEGYVGSFHLRYRDGRLRHMLYGLVLHKGRFYHIQFISPDVPNETLQLLASGLFDGFQINTSESP